MTLNSIYLNNNLILEFFKIKMNITGLNYIKLFNQMQKLYLI